MAKAAQLFLWDVPTSTSNCDATRTGRRPAERPNRAELQPHSPPRAVATTALEQLRAEADRYAELAYADNTRRARQHDWDAFEDWCAENGARSLPADVDIVRCYLTHLAKLGLKASTIRRARISIGMMHEQCGVPRPDRTARTREVERGIAKVHGGKEEGARPLLEPELSKMVATLRDSPRELRDRALILVGFFGAFRACELCALRFDDVSFTPDGVRLRLASSKGKGSRKGEDEHTALPFGNTSATCPVEALRAWIACVGRAAGPLFRVIEGARIEHQRMSERAVTRAVQRACARAGVEGHYSSHSLRKGLCTAAYVRGERRHDIQKHARIKCGRTLERYLYPELVRGSTNVADGLL